MKLLVLALAVAACGAAKLDRTYLPPSSAATAGGSPGALQAPTPGAFDAVAVDAASGSRLAAFKDARPSFGASQNYEAPAQQYNAPAQAYNAPAQAYNAPVQAYNAPAKAYNAPAQAYNAPAQAYNAPAQQYNAAVQTYTAPTQEYNGLAQTSQGTYSNQAYQPAERAQAALERSAAILRQESDVGPESFSYSFETENGISAEENGIATNGVQAQGAFAYTGDDGQQYSVTYTADENGYRPQGAHLPTPHPIPEEILRSIEQNARDEAAGIVDEGSYDEAKYGASANGNEAANSYQYNQGASQISAYKQQSARVQNYLPPQAEQVGVPQKYSNAPAEQYGAPAQQQYEAPVQQYNAPAQKFNAPSQQYKAQRISTPIKKYNAPAPKYNAPAPTYGAPAQQYNAVPQQYEAPAAVEQTKAPAPQYGAPAAQQYRAPTGPAQQFGAKLVQQAAPSPQYGAPAPQKYSQGGQSYSAESGYQYSQPGATGPASEAQAFGAIRQPPSFSPDSGYKY